jgi:hypothetical protein
VSEEHVSRGADRARKTPYELVFGETDFEIRVFPRIREEARLQNVDPRDHDRFAFLSVVGEALRDVLPEDAPADAIDQYRAILFHSYNFWRFGRRHYLLEPAVARFLVEAAPGLENWELDLPHPTLYLQLPANLFWGSISPESVPEPVDGFFVTCSQGVDGLGKPFVRLEVLVVLGIRRDRAGFSVVPFSTEVGPGIPAIWAESPGRDEGRDFENMLPGGDLSGLYSILTTTEALKLLARTLWFVATNPGGAIPTSPVERLEPRSPDDPPHPEHAYIRITLEPDGPREESSE